MNTFSKKQIKLLLLINLFLLLFSVVGSALHYHDNQLIDDDCPVCRFQVYDMTTDEVIEAVHFIPKETLLPAIDFNHEIKNSIRSILTVFPNAPPVI